MKKKQVIVSIQDKYIKCILVAICKSDIKILDYIIHPVENIFSRNSSDISKEIKELFAKKGWSKYSKRIIYNAPNLYVRDIEIDDVGEEDLFFELKKSIVREFGTIENKKLIYEVVERFELEEKRMVKIFFVLFPQEHLLSIEKSNMNIERVDFNIFNFQEIFSRYVNNDRNELFIGLNYEETHLMMYSGKSLEVYRQINAGVDEFKTVLEQRLNMSAADSLGFIEEYGYITKNRAEEILLDGGSEQISQINFFHATSFEKIIKKIGYSVEYFKNQNRGIGIDKIYFFGDGVNIKNLKEAIAQKLDVVDFEILDISDDYRVVKKNLGFLNENLSFVSHLGAAKKKRALIKFEKKKRFTFKIDLSYIVIVILLLGSFLFINGKYIKGNSALKEIDREIVKLEEVLKEHKVLTEKLELLKARDLTHYLSDKESVLIFLDKLSNATVEEIYYTKLKINSEKIVVEGRILSEVSKKGVIKRELMLKLEESYKVNEILFDEKSERDFSGDFLIELDLKGGDSDEEKSE